MSWSLLTLPDDILFNILLYLSIIDVLSLRQTCRILHAFGGNDYLWHRLIAEFDLPLNLPPGIPVFSTSADLLQQAAIKAIRLELNWRRPISRIRQSVSLSKGMKEPYTHMEFLPGGQWLLTTQKFHRMLTTRLTTRVCVWSFANVGDPHCVFRVELSGMSRSIAMALKPSGNSAFLVLGIEENLHQFLEMRSISLRENVDSSYMTRSSPSPETWKRLELPPYPIPGERVIQDLHIVDGILAVTVAIIGEHGDVSWHILLTNPESGKLRWVNPRFTQEFGLLQVRIQAGRIYLLEQRHSSNHVHVYNLPLNEIEAQHPSLLSVTILRNPSQGYDFIDLGDELYQHSHSLPHGVQTMADMLHVPRVFTTNIPVTLFDITDPASFCGWGYTIHYSFDARTGGVPADTPAVGVWIPCGDATAQQLVQIGTTGRRMVWMEHELETGKNKVMKYQMAGSPRGCEVVGGVEEKERVIHGLLLPSEPNLPFALNACNRLAFDEVSGRLCLAFYDGALHVLDFA